jgi:hypothetical protein
LTGSLRRGQATQSWPEPHPQGNGNEAPRDNPRRRKRHPAWVSANALARQWFTKEIVDEEVRYAREYYEDVKDLYIVLFNFICRIALILPYVTRFSPQYADRIWRKLKYDYMPFLKVYRDFLFITLTINPKKFTSQYDAYIEGTRIWNILLTRIRKMYPDAIVLRSFEWQKNGLGFHIHVLIAGVDYIDKDWLMDTWQRMSESGWAIELKRLSGEPHMVIRYIFKYIVKSAGGGPDDISTVINWLLNARAFGRSMPKRFRERLKEKHQEILMKIKAERERECPDGKFEYLGKIPSLYAELAKDVDWVIDYFMLNEDRGPP